MYKYCCNLRVLRFVFSVIQSLCYFVWGKMQDPVFPIAFLHINLKNSTIIHQFEKPFIII